MARERVAVQLNLAHPAWKTLASTLVSYGLVLLVIFAVLFVVPTLIASVV
jgi:hypothetical protein